MSANEGNLAVVYPYEITTCQGDRISSPYIFRVQLGDVDVSGTVSGILVINSLNCLLDYDILRSIGHPKAFTSDNARATNADNGLVGGDVDWRNSSFVVCHRDRSSTGTSISICAPVNC